MKYFRNDKLIMADSLQLNLVSLMPKKYEM